MKIVKKILSTLLSIMLVFSLCLAVYTIVVVRQGTVPKLFGYGILRIASGSMEPEFPVGSFILIRDVDVTTLEEGDVITFISRERAIKGYPNTHRIVSINKEDDGTTTFTTKGDANTQNDSSSVHTEDVVGRVNAKLGFLEFLAYLTDHPNVFFPIVIIPLFIILVWQFISVVRSKAELMGEEENKNDTDKQDKQE